MINRFIIAGYLILLLLPVNGQNDATTIANNEKWIIKFAPVNLLDPVNPALQFGIEKSVSNKSSLQFEVGYIIPCTLINIPDSVSPDYRGYKLRAEYRYYAKILNPRLKLYFGTEVYFVKNKGRDSERFRNETLQLTYADEFGFEKTMFGLNLKAGLQKRIDRFVYDAYIGFGLKHKHTVHSDRIYPGDKMFNLEFNMSNYTNIEMNGWIWNGPLFNFKIGYILK